MWTGSVNIMTLRLIDERVANTILSTATDKHVGTAHIAKATGLDMQGTHDRLAGVVPFTVSELVQVGGLLSVPPWELLEGTTAP